MVQYLWQILSEIVFILLSGRNSASLKLLIRKIRNFLLYLDMENINNYFAAYFLNLFITLSLIIALVALSWKISQIL